MVNVFKDTLLLIGGKSEDLETLNKTFIVKVREEGLEWDIGPDLDHAIESLMCGIMEKDEGTYVVVVGGIVSGSWLFNDCQYLEMPDLTAWKSCTKLFSGRAEGQLLTDPESGDLILIGGRSNDGYESTILRLSSITGDWSLENTLEVRRTLHTSMFVPDDQLLCENTKSKHDEL